MAIYNKDNKVAVALCLNLRLKGVDEVSERIRSQSNAMLAEQAAAAHLLKYKAKKSRRQTAHLKIQNNKLKQAVEEEQLKFRN